jgi:hypothetical protein
MYNMDLYDYGKINKYLLKHNNKMDTTFNEIIIDLIKFTNFNYKIFKKILEGSYVIINDKGYFYKKWVKKYKKNLPNIFNNISSHKSYDLQYRLGNGYICSLDGEKSDSFDFLLGTHKITKNTWFQLERNRLTSFTNILGHIYDYLQYLISNKNIGPFGESIHSEKKNQIILNFI